MFYLGLDLGQKRDHSAICVVERNGQSPTFLVRHLERVPLGTPYPAVVRRVRKIIDGEPRGQCAVAVDGTGVGTPVVDMLREALFSATGPACDVSAVTITGGERETQSGQTWNVPKRDLLAGVQVLLDHDALRIARDLRDTGPLVRELMEVRSTRRENGRIRLGADGCGEHDDLVIALALACWRAKRVRPTAGFGTRRLAGI